MSGSIWQNSGYLDLTGSGIISPNIDPSATNAVQEAYGFTAPGTIDASGSIVVALVLPRQNDPTALLAEDWAQREAQLSGLTPAQVGAEYGADPTIFQQLTTSLEGIGADVLGTANGYVTSAASRTVWVSLNATQFQDLFGQQLLQQSGGGMPYWEGNLTPNGSVLPALAGMWVDGTSAPAPAALDSTTATLSPGVQGAANSAGADGQTADAAAPSQNLYSDQIAAENQFPLTVTGVTSVATPTIGLIEPGISDTDGVSGSATQLLQAYRSAAGISGTGTVSEGAVETAGTSTAGLDERSLDYGVVGGAAPNSNIIDYAGAGNVYTAFEEAIWGGGPEPSDLSDSYELGANAAPGSPFLAAIQGLFQDAALNNISVFNMTYDGGSSSEIGTGLPQTDAGIISPTVVSVGGTSTSSQQQLASIGTAQANASIANLVQQAVAGNVGTLEILVAGGLTQDPTGTSVINDFLQTVWNQYAFNNGTISPGYQQNEASGGGVDGNLPEPAYQQDAGINVAALQTAAGIPDAAGGKGVPDVSALAGGNTHYLLPGSDLTGVRSTGGTSASTPLWASLSAQIQAVFLNQGLPTTGYFNDLLYQAAVIDPASFNDVQFGDNTSSFIAGGTIADANGSGTSNITPTGLGFSAGPGYDLASGLGTPDGILLARALTQIAQAQMYSPNTTPVSDSAGLVSAANQALIVQPVLASGFTGTLTAAGDSYTPASDGSGLGWSAQIAQDVLQSYVSPALAAAIGGQDQASSTQLDVTDGQSLAVSIGGAAATPTAQQDTSGFGYVTDDAGGSSVTLARPLAIVQTYGGADNATAVVRIRQDSPDQDALSFYRVDDLDGDINGIAPGQAGYAAAAAAREYTFANGTQSVAGPGADNFAQTTLTGVNNGDIIGFDLTDQTTGQTIWGLASQNAGGTNALWSYGADTWGFDDGASAGQGAFSDLVFQLDFTSEGGSGLLVNDTLSASAVSITGTAANQPTTNQQAINPFTSVSISDPNTAIDQSITEAVTVSLTGAKGELINANGTLSGSGLLIAPGITSTATNGIYLLAPGTPAQVTQELQGLTFTPTPGQVAVGSTVPTIFTINVTDSLGQSVTDDTTSVEATAAPCFARGTRIAAPGGEVRIEALRSGDLVLTLGGRLRPIVWTGHRAMKCDLHPHPHKVRPVRIRAQAFGPGCPARDLLVSPDHAIFIEGVLVPARLLVNGRSVVRAAEIRCITYHHIELESHDVILAEGLPAESYLDAAARHAFDGGAPARPSAADDVSRVWEAAGYAPLVVHGTLLEAARRRLQ